MSLAVASNRLKHLEQKLVAKGNITFTLEDGGEYRPSEDPFIYLSKYGRQSPAGKLITGIRSEDLEEADALTLAILETLNEVAAGRMPLPTETAHAMEKGF